MLKLSGYKFSKECVEKLVEKFPKQIIGVKDSSYNLFEELKLENFSVMPGSESKLLKGLNLGCTHQEFFLFISNTFSILLQQPQMLLHPWHVGFMTTL